MSGGQVSQPYGKAPTLSHLDCCKTADYKLPRTLSFLAKLNHSFKFLKLDPVSLHYLQIEVKSFENGFPVTCCLAPIHPSSVISCSTPIMYHPLHLFLKTSCVFIPLRVCPCSSFYPEHSLPLLLWSKFYIFFAGPPLAQLL